MAQLSTFTLLLFFSINFTTQAQSKEYIVSYDNDTIYGDVKRKTNLLDPSKVEYKIKLSNGKRVDIDAKEFKQIHTIDGVDGDSYFEAFAESSFVKLIIDGRIKLYNHPSSAIYFISKDNSRIRLTTIGQPFSNKKAHAEMVALLQDKPQTLEEFNQLKGTLQNIIYIIYQFNSRLTR